MPDFILTVRCTSCSKHYSPKDLLGFLTNIRICGKCYERHEQAIAALNGQRMAECADCHATAEELAAASKDGNVRMMVHLADGVYALMCRKCSDAYALKRADLYGETQYGKERGIGT